MGTGLAVSGAGVETSVSALTQTDDFIRFDLEAEGSRRAGSARERSASGPRSVPAGLSI